ALLPPVDLILITTPDDATAETAHRLAALITTTPRKHRAALHTSGALSSRVLAPLRARGFSVGSMHPLVSVSDAAAGVESLRTAFYCVEGERRAAAAAREIVRRLGGRSFSIDTADKPLYHAAAVMTSGHTVALFDIAAELLARCGLPATRARRVLLPLLRSTLQNLAARAPSRALTGTFARADVETVRKHLAALDGQSPTEAAAVYRLLGLRSLLLAAENGVDAAALGEIGRLLKRRKAEGGRRKAEGRRQKAVK
ncbi:MAG: Rossmann-like and DUF2520 domain-containing protein, partial [Pyrinomonadaceae bacterium]